VNLNPAPQESRRQHRRPKTQRARRHGRKRHQNPRR
jgi:hypothetical protein